MVIFHSYVSWPEGNDLKNLQLICTSQNATWVTESPAPVVPSPGTRHAPRRTWGPKMRHADWVRSHWGDKMWHVDWRWFRMANWHQMIITSGDSHPMISAAHLMRWKNIFPLAEMHRLQLFLSKLLLSLLLRLVPLLPLLFGKQALPQWRGQWPNHCRTNWMLLELTHPNRLGVSETWKTGDSSIPSTRMWKISWPALTICCNYWKPLQLTEKQIKILNRGKPKRTTKIEYHPLHQVFNKL